jgi:hypothetical protein
MTTLNLGFLLNIVYFFWVISVSLFYHDIKLISLEKHIQPRSTFSLFKLLYVCISNKKDLPWSCKTKHTQQT